MKQKTIINANMWTPKQLFTTQTFFFCSTGDEERMGGAILEGDTRNDDHLFLGTEGKEFPEWEVILWGLGHRGVVPDSDPLDRVLPVADAPKRVLQQPLGLDPILSCRLR